MARDYGRLVISLDFELHWGVRDHARVADYRANLLGVRAAVPALLALFRRYDVHATWATVGFLFAETRRELLAAVPTLLPAYDDPALSPYPDLADVGADERADPFHFAPSLLRQIAATSHQEIGTHTLSHYYCLEAGQSAAAFEADLRAAAAIGQAFGPVCRSLVFPRNQFNPAYLPVLQRCGVRVYRGNGAHWAYRGLPGRAETAARRAARLLDAYLPVARDRTAPTPPTRSDAPTDVPASAFLRPFAPRLRRLDGLRLRRFTGEMSRAARAGRRFHLWWHPHNFGVHLGANLAFLTDLLEHFAALRRRYGMLSATMAEAAGAA